jgi:hypothetical protein
VRRERIEGIEPFAAAAALGRPGEEQGPQPEVGALRQAAMTRRRGGSAGEGRGRVG